MGAGLSSFPARDVQRAWLRVLDVTRPTPSCGRTSFPDIDRAARLRCLLGVSQYAPSSSCCGELPNLGDLVDDPVFLGLGGGQDLIPVDVGTNTFHGLTGVLSQSGFQ